MVPLLAVPLLVVVLLALFLWLILWWLVTLLEDRILYPGAKIDRYRVLTRGSFRVLPSGGGLLHYGGSGRRVLFLHGNSGSLDLYEEIFRHMYDRGYDVYAVEYYGYGVCWPGNSTVTVPSKDQESRQHLLLLHVLEAWREMGSADCVVVGFSLGGGILGMVYNQLNPQPAQLVFINTFCDTRKLVAEFLPFGLGRWVTPFMSNRWSVQPAQPHVQCHVTVVCTRDDQLIPGGHSRNICDTFAHLQPRLIVLPDGGHALSLARYYESLIDDPQAVLPSGSGKNKAENVGDGGYYGPTADGGEPGATEG